MPRKDVQSKGFEPTKENAQPPKLTSSAGVDTTSQSVHASQQTISTMQGVASSNVGHFIERLAQG